MRYRSLLLATLVAVPAWAAMDGPTATAAYEAVRKDPARHKLYCEMEDLKGKSIQAQMSGDYKMISTYGRRITEIEGLLPEYRDAIRFEASKASDMGYAKTPEGKALYDASRNLALSCKKK